MATPVRRGRPRPGDIGFVGVTTPTSRARVALMFDLFRSEVRSIFVQREIEETILFDIQDRFVRQSKQRDPDTGTPWARLAPTTPARRKLNIGTRKKLLDTGSLQDALFINRARMVTALSIGVGISTITVRSRPSQSSPNINLVRIARIHQFGDDNVPARPFLGVSKREGREIETLFRVRLIRSTPGFGNPMR